MLSTDHFRQELQAQLRHAAAVGAIDILINSGELCRSIQRFTGDHGLVSCCDAMQDEIRPGDILLLERANGTGMTVRYRLPRTA